MTTDPRSRDAAGWAALAIVMGPIWLAAIVWALAWLTPLTYWSERRVSLFGGLIWFALCVMPLLMSVAVLVGMRRTGRSWPRALVAAEISGILCAIPVTVLGWWW